MLELKNITKIYNSGAGAQKALDNVSISFAGHEFVSILGACGVHSVDTKSEIVKILHFKQFYKHYVFVEDGEGGRKKVLKNYIDVNVCIDMVCGDTKNALESEDY